MAVKHILEEELETRKEIAEDPETDSRYLESLAEDPNKIVRRRVAKNEKTPPKTLAALANDPDKRVRLNVADNSKTPSDVLVKLAMGSDTVFALHLAENPNTPAEIVEKLINNPYLTISDLSIIAQRTDLTETTYSYVARELTKNNPKFLKAFKKLK